MPCSLSERNIRYRMVSEEVYELTPNSYVSNTGIFYTNWKLVRATRPSIFLLNKSEMTTKLACSMAPRGTGMFETKSVNFKL